VTKRGQAPSVGRYAASDPRRPKTPDRAIGFVGIRNLIIGNYTMGAVITWADLLARSDIQIFSKAQFDKP